MPYDTLPRRPLTRSLLTTPTQGQAIKPPAIIVDSRSEALGDPDGNCIGDQGVYVDRLLTALPLRE